MNKLKRQNCKNGKDCPYLKLPGGCKFRHTHKEFQYGRKMRKKIKKRKKNTQQLNAKNISEIQEKVVEQQENTEQLNAKNISEIQENTAQQVLVRPQWITMHKGCSKCSQNGCNQCYYRIRKDEIVTAPTQCRLPREIACRICGAIGDADHTYCLKCGL